MSVRGVRLVPAAEARGRCAECDGDLAAPLDFHQQAFFWRLQWQDRRRRRSSRREFASRVERSAFAPSPYRTSDCRHGRNKRAVHPWPDSCRVLHYSTSNAPGSADEVAQREDMSACGTQVVRGATSMACPFTSLDCYNGT